MYNKTIELNRFLRFILDGLRDITETEALTRQRVLGLDNLVPPFVVAEVSPVYDGCKIEEKDALIAAVESYVTAFLKNQCLNVYCVTNSYNNVQVILSSYEHTKKIDEVFVVLRNKLLAEFGLDSFIGIGSATDKMTGLARSASDARLMLAYKFQYADRGVINISNLVQYKIGSDIGSGIAFERVIGCFQDGNLGKMERRISELIEYARQKPNATNISIKLVLAELTIRLLNVSSLDADVEELLGGRDPYRWIIQQKKIEDITDWILQLASEMLLQTEKRNTLYTNPSVAEAIDYIDANLNLPEMNLMTICKKIGMSKSYFSQLFKSKMGLGINEYINIKRIERAKRLLSETDMRIEDIALQTGYTSKNYFNRVFNKFEGITPGQYRRKHNKI